MSKISFTQEQVRYMIQKTGEDDPDRAIDSIIEALRKEKADPEDIKTYVIRLMEMDSKKKK